MKRFPATLLYLLLAASATGCALCHTPFDDAYSAYGGVAPRHDMMRGRAGSILSEPAHPYDSSTPADGAAQSGLYPVETGQTDLEEIHPQGTSADGQ